MYFLFYFMNSDNSDIAESTNAISSLPVTKNEGQRELLTNLLSESKVDCVICYDRAQNTEQIWSCLSCYQIMHLKCVTVWYIKSHRCKY